MPRAGSRRLPRGIFLVWLALASALFLGGPARAGNGSDPAETVGVPWTGEPGVTETVAEIMEREARAPKIPTLPGETGAPGRRPAPIGVNPASPAVPQWPFQAGGALASQVGPLAPQTVGTNFKAISLLSPNESQFLPPDSMGGVGPTQILAIANGRIKVFDRTGVLGGLNVTDGNFFASVTGPSGVTDPQIRYDRLSGRWFVTELTTTSPNRILIAVSSGPTITSTSSFTFFSFQHDLVGSTPNSDTGRFADYDSLGVDRSALYIGVDVFDASGTPFIGTTGFVVNKANLLAGSLTVTAFRQLGTGSASGPFAPRGVSNDDPGATEGYFIGVDTLFFDQLDIRRVGNPGGVPSISPNILLTVPTTSFPIIQVAKGSIKGLDALDDRLFSATIHRNKLTGVTSLSTAQNIQVDSTGVATDRNGRNGSRWYEITNLTSTPSLRQSGTLFDPASTGPRGFWIATVAESGQGHMALGSSYASANDFAGVATAGRLRTDALGTIKAATLAQVSATSYNQPTVNPKQRWGDYSQTLVDPADDMTFWTIQEWCDATTSWGVQVVQLKAPPPAAPASAAPSSVCSDLPSVSVTLGGVSSSGSEFFDPGSDAGGPGFPDHLSAAVTGGVSVNSIAFVDPTHVTLNLSTVGAAAGPRDVTVTNPDGQSSTGAGVLTITGAPAPAASNNGPICSGGTLQLSASTAAGATYAWTGPNGFTSTAQNPSIPGVNAAATGTYSVTITVGGCTSTASSTTATVLADGAACSDGNACTVGDACLAGACLGGPPKDADVDGHVDALCGGDDCDDTAASVWHSPSEVTRALADAGSPMTLSWDSQDALSGPGTVYDLASGTIVDGTPIDLTQSVCLQSGGGASFTDTRADPAVGTVFWYLVRAVNVCGIGTYGTSQEDASIMACP